MKRSIQPAVISVLGLLVAIGGFKVTDTPPDDRVGYLSISQLVSQIPEYTKKRGTLDTLVYEFNVTLQSKLAEFQKKQQAFFQDSTSLNEIVKADRVKELQSLSESIQTFRQVSDQEVRRQDSVLVQPILSDLQQAIDAVAAESGFTLVINTDVRAGNGTPMVLYADDTNDINNSVLEAYESKK